MTNPYPQLTTCPDCDLRDRHSIAQDYYIQFLNRLDSMFHWTGLPDTIPERILERYLKTIGWCGIAYIDELPSSQLERPAGLYCFFGGLGSTPDEYYQPTQIIMANPVLGSRSWNIGVDCVWAKNDSMASGISPILSRYAHLIAANDISINIAQVTTRMPFALTAETNNDYESAKEYIKQAEEGKLAIIRTSAFNKGVEPKPTVDSSTSNYLKALIELHQYLKAQFANDIGIGSNYNMKRERLSEAEAELNNPYLLPLADEMLKFRKQICDDVNAMFGTNWSVDFNSAWKLEGLKQDLQVEVLKAEADDTDSILESGAEDESSQLETEEGEPEE